MVRLFLGNDFTDLRLPPINLGNHFISTNSEDRKIPENMMIFSCTANSFSD